MKIKAYRKFYFYAYHPKSHPDNMYEYIVGKLDNDIGIEFDSLHETFNGIQYLSKKEALQSAKDIIDEYYSGEMKSFFDGEENKQ